jgi:hypothetical protein
LWVMLKDYLRFIPKISLKRDTNSSENIFSTLNLA